MAQAKPTREFDVWILASNTVYKRVPFGVVTDWAQQGRLGTADKLRTAGTDAWSLVGDDPVIADFLFQVAPAKPVRKSAEMKREAKRSIAAIAQAETEGVVWVKHREDDDDEVDMIPLIDISLVLLIFFMMTSAVTALSPVDVPRMKNAFETKAVPDVLIVAIEKRPNGDAVYSLRVGDKAPEREDNEIDTLAALLVRLDVRLADNLVNGSGASEVRVACHHELPSERVHDVVKELEPRKRSGKISIYRAEVNEKK